MNSDFILDILEDLRKLSAYEFRKNGDTRYYYSLLICTRMLETEYNYYAHCSNYKH